MKIMLENETVVAAARAAAKALPGWNSASLLRELAETGAADWGEWRWALSPDGFTISAIHRRGDAEIAVNENGFIVSDDQDSVSFVTLLSGDTEWRVDLSAAREHTGIFPSEKNEILKKSLEDEFRKVIREG